MSVRTRVAVVDFWEFMAYCAGTGGSILVIGSAAGVAAMVPRIRAQVTVPVGVGFGIRDAATAKAISRVADAVVIGSKIIQLIDKEPREQVVPVVKAFLSEIRRALDA